MAASADSFACYSWGVGRTVLVSTVCGGRGPRGAASHRPVDTTAPLLPPQRRTRPQMFLVPRLRETGLENALEPHSMSFFLM